MKTLQHSQLREHNMDVLCTWAKLLKVLQIWGSELHKNAPPGPAGGAIALLQTS